MSHNKKEPQEIPEVAAYIESRDMLSAFRQANSRIFDTYDDLVDDLNQKLEAADKAVRAREVSCDDWDLYQYQIKVDAEALFDALGLDGFLAVGGTTSVKTTYSADKAKIEAAVARGDLSKGIADSVITKSPRYHAPKKVT